MCVTLKIVGYVFRQRRGTCSSCQRASITGTGGERFHRFNIDSSQPFSDVSLAKELVTAMCGEVTWMRTTIRGADSSTGVVDRDVHRGGIAGACK